MAFKDNFRIEKIYFQRVKDDAQILGSWKNDPRRYSREEIVRVAKDACDSVLMLYRLLGECWNDALNQIEKISAELEALAGKAEAYHDELNEKIDEVNNYLNHEIKIIEAQIDAFGGLPSNANAEEGDVLTVGEHGVNEWKPASGGDAYLIEARFNETEQIYELYHNGVLLSVTDLKNAADNKYMVIYIVEYDEDEEAYKTIYFPIEDVNKYDFENNYFLYELHFIRRFMPHNFGIDLGINTTYFNVGFGNYNEDEETEEEWVSCDYSPEYEYNMFYCVVSNNGNESIMTSNVSNMRVDYNPSYNALSSHFSTNPNSIRVLDGELGIIYILKAESKTGYVDGTPYQGILFSFTNFTFTNSVLNTRSLFLYENGIAEYSATP